MWIEIGKNLIDTDKYQRFWKDEYSFTTNNKRGYMIMADKIVVFYSSAEDGDTSERDKEFNGLALILGSRKILDED